MEITALYEKPIIQKENWILRNLQITQSYHELTLWMQQVIGRENVSWVAFATYASKTAGHSIRHEQLPEAVNDLAARLVRKGGPKAIAHQYLMDPAARQGGSRFGAIESVYLRVSNNVSLGNCIVYNELAPLFRTFIDQFKDDLRYNEAKLQRFLAHLRPGPTLEGGQDQLAEAFTNFYQARFDPKAKRKAEKILLANALVGLHEQTRLQPMIAEAMAAPITELVGGRLPDWMARLADTPAFGKHSLSQILIDWFNKLLTESVMTISAPGLPQRLAQDVKSPTSTRYPKTLQIIESPRLHEVLSSWMDNESTLTGSAANNWARLEDRMAFIFPYFRSHQQNPMLYTPPFTSEQQTAIRAGHIPGGGL